MTRWDETGLFWDDYVAPRVPIEKIKRTPPDPVWLLDDYLPDLDVAKAYKFNLMTDQQLMLAKARKERLVWDIEIYPNYLLIGFKSIDSDLIVMFEMLDNDYFPNKDKLRWIFDSFTLIGFNDHKFDVPLAQAILAGYSTTRLAQCATDLIHGGPFGLGLSPREFYKEYKIKNPIKIDSIDLIELSPLGPSLKISAGRIHAPRMADLPFPAGRNLTPDQRTILRWYWTNDLDNTAFLYREHKTAIELREILTTEYKVDVRSKSDPQVAEAIIRSEISRITGHKYFSKATIEPGRTFRYYPPAYLKFTTPNLKWVLGFIQNEVFTVDHGGSPVESPELKNLVLPIGRGEYSIGIGGLHSKEKRSIHVAGDDCEISDNDVTSYYPSMMIQLGMYPPNIGPVFLQVFKRIYDRRLAAKTSGDKATSETLKIVLNGTFGKTGERGGHSVVYYPEMMIQVTLTGQLSLLMLIEALEEAGIEVISANTDGVTVKCPTPLLETKAQIMAWWQLTTGLGLESKTFKAVYSRDVNNYIALLDKPDEKEQTAHRYAKAIGAYRKVTGAYPLKWNPTCDVCTEAVIAFLATGKPIEQSIREEIDIRKFIEVRRVTGGAVKDGIYLGKAIRWYYSTEVKDEIINAKSGYIVPRSLGGKPCMTLPPSIPVDLDYQYYIERALSTLADFEPKVKKVVAVAA